jgi:hypothetical protein
VKLEFDVWFRILMATMIITGLAARASNFWRWLMRRRTRETNKLAIALRSELLALLEVYETNLRLIDEDAGYLIPARTLPHVYRGNLARLTTLDAEVIPAVVTFYAGHERIEALLSLRAAPGQRREGQAMPSYETLQREYRAGCAAIARALAALAPPEEAELSAGVAVHQLPAGAAAVLSVT